MTKVANLARLGFETTCCVSTTRVSPNLVSFCETGAYDAQDLAKASSERLGVTPVPSLNLVCTKDGEYVTAEYAKEQGLEINKLSGTKFRQMLRGGEDIPTWFAFSSVVKVLRDNM